MNEENRSKCPEIAAGGQDLLKLVEPLIVMTGGLTLSQVAEVTGLQGTTIQNWVKRGWVENPTGKKYGEQQLVRIFLINMLRGTMQLDEIVALMSYINGKVDDRSDDIIPDKRLYTFLCTVNSGIAPGEYGNTEKIRTLVKKELESYNEPIEGARQKLEDSLTVMALACQAAKIKNAATAEFRKLNIQQKGKNYADSNI